ncbi:SH3 domain-containing protein [Leptotrichia sp. oral taxon 223]|uniref:SH3 domain-containing protein n=1 Tax=Leptotrichia sp. oral taxon 223 TaxID=712363 RepID=UPI0015B7CEDC|nr:SH3 domain-containing protein [Leptotrichia sp. oral taxon 223]NWO19041.1 SH3 domain-containing protein [Leptotrichia sp. oral taxon 223]
MKSKINKGIFFIFFLVLLFCFIGKSDTDKNHKATFKPVNIEGLLVASIDEDCYDDNDEDDSIIFDLIPKDKNSYNGKTLEIELSRKDKEKFLKENFNEANKLLAKKIDYAVQPVIINVSNIGVRLTCGAGFPVYYAKISSVTKLKNTKAIFLKNLNDLEDKKYKTKMKKIRPKENAEVKKLPEINASIIGKTEKGEEFMVINKYGDWYYIIFAYPAGTGYIHKKQIETELK